MISYSLSDIRLISELAQYSEQELIKPENDQLMAKYLYKIGMNCYNAPWNYFASFHRNLRDEVVLGYTVYGDVRNDEEFRESVMYSMTHRLINVGYESPDLLRELSELNYKTRDFESALQDMDSIDFDEKRALFPVDQMEPDWQDREAQVKALNDLLLEVRGDPYNNYGSLKMMDEYQKGSND